MTKIYLGTDHAGFELKEKIKTYLKEKGFVVEDQGAYAIDPEDDYTDYVKIVTRMVQGETDSRGIILGGSGQGEAICANRFPGIRAALYYGPPLDIIKLSREHNNTNILSLGARFLKFEEAIEAIDLWLSTAFSNDDRHVRRIYEVDDGSMGKVI